MKFFAQTDPYRAGDRVFAMLDRPDVALLLTCDEPANWTAMVFDMRRKEAVASAHHHASVAEAQKYAIAQVRTHYKVAPSEGEIRWQKAINRPDILQT